MLRRSFLEYASHLGLEVPFFDRLLEVAEMHEVLAPAARVRFPDPIVRRWNRERYPQETLVEPLADDGELFERATSFCRRVVRAISGLMDPAAEHVLDEVAAEHAEFVKTTFPRSGFVPWATFSTKVFLRNGVEIGDNGEYVWSFYHGWQVFQLAAFLRTGASIYFDPTAHPSLGELDADDSGGVYVAFKWSGKRDLQLIADNRRYFEAVAYFSDCCHVALQPIAMAGIDSMGRLLPVARKECAKRKREIAQRTLSRFSLDVAGVIGFVAVQAELHDNAKDDSQNRVAEAYRDNIDATLELLRLNDRRLTFAVVNQRVGIIGGHVRPVLESIFPDWIDEQRALVEGSLRHWVLPALRDLPFNLSVNEGDATAFCDWLEARGFYQFYWHFRRLADVGLHDDRISRAANASEVASLVSLVEHVCNRILADRNPPESGWTLFPKVVAVVRPGKLANDLARFRGLTSTGKRSLRQQLAAVRQIRRGNQRANACQLLLRLVLLRNATSHLGIAGFSSAELYEMLRSLLAAAVLLWKAR